MARKPYARMKKLVAIARGQQDKSTAAIWRFAPWENARFHDCYANAPYSFRKDCDDARVAVIHAEREAVSAGTAWFASFGMLVFYQ